MRTFIVHLRGLNGRETMCGTAMFFANDGKSRNGIEVLPEGDHLSPYERLCQRCAAKHVTPDTASVQAKGRVSA